MQQATIISSKLQLKQELEINYSHYLKEKRQLSEISNKIRTLKTKAKANLNQFFNNRKWSRNSKNKLLTKQLINKQLKSRIGNHKTSMKHNHSEILFDCLIVLLQLQKLLKLSTKHSFIASPKVEQSPYLQNNKFNVFNFFGKDTVTTNATHKSPKQGYFFNPQITKLKTDNSEVNIISPAYSPKKETERNQEIVQKEDYVKLPPIKYNKQNKHASNLSLNLKQLLIESPYAQQMKKYDYLFKKRELNNKRITGHQTTEGESNVSHEFEKYKKLQDKIQNIEQGNQNHKGVIKAKQTQKLFYNNKTYESAKFLQKNTEDNNNNQNKHEQSQQHQQQKPNNHD